VFVLYMFYYLSLSSSFLVAHLFVYLPTANTEIYSLSLHDALPILAKMPAISAYLVVVTTFCDASSALSSSFAMSPSARAHSKARSEEHTSELQSRFDLVCRLLLEKKNQPASKIVLLLYILNNTCDC